MSQKEAGRLQPHKHCRVCGISISPSKEYCSNECKEQDLRTQKRMKRWNRLFILSMVFLMLFLVLGALLRSA